MIEYLLIKNRLISLSPDLVILVFFSGADVCDDQGYSKIAKFDNKGLPISVSPPKSAENIKKQNNRKGAFFYKELQIVSKIINFALRGFKKTTREPIFYGDIISEKNVVVGADVGLQDAWEKTKYYLKAIDSFLKNRGIKFILVLMPAGHHVNGKEWDTGRKIFSYKVGLTYKNIVNEHTVEFCRENNIYCYNLLDCFQASDIYPIYYRGDGHLTVAGNKLTADYLHDFLIKNNLIRR